MTESQLSNIRIIKVVAIDIRPLEDSPACSDLPKCIIEELQLNNCKTMLVVESLYLALDVLRRGKAKEARKSGWHSSWNCSSSLPCWKLSVKSLICQILL